MCVKGRGSLSMLTVGKILQCLWWVDERTCECGALLECMDRTTKYSGKKTCPHVTFSTINPTWFVLGLNLCLYDESLANTVIWFMVQERSALLFCMEWSPCKNTNISSASLEIPCVLSHLMFYYHVHNRLPRVLILSYVNPVHALPFCFFKVRCSIVFQVVSVLSVSVTPLCHAYHMLHPSHLPRFDHPKNMWWELQAMMLLIMSFSPLLYHFPSFRSTFLLPSL
jgi:hypothetical protein